MGIRKEIKELPASLLSVDPRVQRVVDMSRVRKIARSWDDLMVGVITVSHRVPGLVSGLLDEDAKDEFVILDGQTRWNALKMVCGMDTTTCTLTAQTYTGLTLKEEAAIFLQHNDRKGVTPLDNFRLSLVAGEPWAEGLRDIAAKYRWAVSGTAQEGQRRFNSISAAKKLYLSDETGATFDRTLSVIDAAWPRDPGTVCGESLYGIGSLYASHGGLDTSGFVGKLARLGFNNYFSSIHDMNRAHRSLSLQQAAYLRTVEIYNNGRRSKRIEV